MLFNRILLAPIRIFIVVLLEPVSNISKDGLAISTIIIWSYYIMAVLMLLVKINITLTISITL